MKVIIMIGAAGSGKTHYIKHVLGGDVRVFSANDFFTDARGVYRFEKARLSEAHQECMYQFISAIHNTVLEDQVFVIDNTNVSIEQVAPYMSVARAHGADVELVWMSEMRLNVCYDRNIHDVPLITIEKQLQAQRELRRVWPRHWPRPTIWPHRS